MAPMRYFLIVYDRRRGELLIDPPQEFDDELVAAEAYAAEEEKYWTDRNVEVVLIGADSLETVRQTHSNYFSRFSRSDLSKYLAGV